MDSLVSSKVMESNYYCNIFPPNSVHQTETWPHPASPVPTSTCEVPVPYSPWSTDSGVSFYYLSTFFCFFCFMPVGKASRCFTSTYWMELRSEWLKLLSTVQRSDVSFVWPACAEPFYVINNLPRSHLSGLIVAVLEMFPLRNTLIMTLIIDKNLPQVRKKRADCAEHKHINHQTFVL